MEGRIHSLESFGLVDGIAGSRERRHIERTLAQHRERVATAQRVGLPEGVSSGNGCGVRGYDLLFHLFTISLSLPAPSALGLQGRGDAGKEEHQGQKYVYTFAQE